MNRLPDVIFEKSGSGKTGFSFSDYQHPQELTALSADKIRQKAADLPEVSEVEVVRHYTNLAHLNHSVDSGFYPLGSCTMKYNPKLHETIAAMEAFVSAHPYSPHSLVQGNLAILHDLERWLQEITGMHRFTLAPAAGAHGELAGMMIIRKYLTAAGDARQTVLIPDSAHGTNPASAHFAGYEIREIPSNSQGILDADTVSAHLDDSVAALMMTNPNTLGLFERNICEIADMLHKNGSQLYMDGANMNAFLGVVRPGDLGVDVIHLNLHKTFSTPHGGGGPGAGPVGVGEHLAPFLPVPRIEKIKDRYQAEYFSRKGIGRIKNFYGNFLVVVRALAYVKSLGKDLHRVAEDAVLNANYLRSKLEPLLDLPYPGNNFHEVVFSDKGLPVKTLDIAKRLLDYGIHPFTVYFPLIVAGAMMIEPTETESKQTLDRFVEVMHEIIREAEDNPEQVQNAPLHTPVSRLDEVRAARHPVLRWRPKERT